MTTPEPTSRPLTERQTSALTLLHLMGFISTHTSKSMPSLQRRGFVEGYRDWSNGCAGHKRWRITEAGHAEAERIRAATVR